MGDAVDSKSATFDGIRLFDTGDLKSPVSNDVPVRIKAIVASTIRMNIIQIDNQGRYFFWNICLCC